ncbi:MAG TPA: hypothetical protein VG347_00870 [Verrucomicrobiae bacterium]|nr:hypothetical protein [Verrucomicrobiae bacterium]
MSRKSPNATFHFRRLRELNDRLAACQSQDAEEKVQELIEAENQRWNTLQQTNEKETQ